MKKRDPNEDWLPHCILCDARHGRNEPCKKGIDLSGGAEDKTGGSPAIQPAATLTKEVA